MATKTIVGKGTQFKIGPVAGTSTPTYIMIGELDDVSPTGRAWATEDVTHFQSPVDDEFVQTSRNPGEWDLTGNRIADDAGQLALEAAHDAGGLYMFEIILPLANGQTTTGETIKFNALVMSADFSKINPKGAIKFNAKLKQSGSRTVTAGV